MKFPVPCTGNTRKHKSRLKRHTERRWCQLGSDGHWRTWGSGITADMLQRNQSMDPSPHLSPPFRAGLLHGRHKLYMFTFYCRNLVASAFKPCAVLWLWVSSCYQQLQDLATLLVAVDILTRGVWGRCKDNDSSFSVFQIFPEKGEWTTSRLYEISSSKPFRKSSK